MPAPYNAALPPFFTLANGYTVRVTAQDPTDGSTVSAVIASNVSLAVDQKPVSTDGSGTYLPTGPLYVPVEAA